MFRHFGIDPTPSRIMRNTAPAVYEWVARMWNARAAKLGSLAWTSGSGGLPDGLEPLLARAARRYLPSLHANARAVAERRRHYSVTLDGKPCPGLTAVPFQAWRRSLLHGNWRVLRRMRLPRYGRHWPEPAASNGRSSME